MKKILLILLIIIMLPITVKAESKYLYDVLKNEAENNGLAKEYTGEHHDSLKKEPSKKIYHWYAETYDDVNAITSKNIVLFGNYCWEMIRTTDTGGVKIMYAGLPTNNKCNNQLKHVGTVAFNENYNSIAYVGYMYNPDTLIVIPENQLPAEGSVFASEISYSEDEYKLTNTQTRLDNSHRYTCNNENNTCSTIRYYYTNKGYIELSNGKTIEEAITDMLSADNVNRINSPIKEVVDNWYERFMTEYTNILEDTVFCNDRSIASTGSWANGNANGNLLFNNYNAITDLSCTNETDRFSVNNPKAKLTYPTAVLTAPEIRLLNNNSVVSTGNVFWTMSPYEYFNEYHNSNGLTNQLARTVVNSSYAVRPVISLKPNTMYTSGNGSSASPYIIDLTSYYRVIVEEPVKKGDIKFETEDISSLQEGAEVKFRITPVKGFALEDLEIVDEEENNVDYTTPDKINFKFTMPATDVTIKPQYKEINNIPNNPNTKRQILLIVISIIILSIMTFIYIKKKKHKN